MPISRKWLLQILSNSLCGVPYLGDSYNAKIVCFGEEAMELCMREKAVFFIPVNILTVWSPAFLAA